MLTDVACRRLITQAKQSNKPVKRGDENGLYLHAFPNGNAYWRYKYRLHGKENTLSFGPYPEFSLLEARSQHTDAFKLVQLNIDPVKARKEQEARAQQEAEQTFERVGRRWLARNKNLWSPRTAHLTELRLQKDLFRSVGRIPVSQLTRKQLLDAVRQIEARQSHEVARRSAQFARSILNVALDEELVTANVAVDLSASLMPFKRQHYPSMELDELPLFLQRLDSINPPLSQSVRDAMDLLMLTLVRTSELIKAEWTEFDWEKALWTIPASRMKMRRKHLVPLSRQAMTILLRRRGANDLLAETGQQSRYVFPSQHGPHKTMCNRNVGLALFALGYRGVHTGHGFRSLGMGIAKEKLGYRHEVPDRQLAHAPASEVDRAYDRALFLSERVEMMQRLGDYIEAAKSKG